MKLNKYINNISSLQFFQLFRFSILLLINILFSKEIFGLSTGEIGVYERFLLIAGGVSFFWISGFIQSLLSMYRNEETKTKEKNSLIFTSYLLLIAFSIMAGLFVVINDHHIATFLKLQTAKLPYLKILVAYIILSGPNNLAEYILLLKNKSKSIIYYGLISFTLQLIFVTTPVLLGYDLGYGLYGLVAVNILKFLYLTYLVVKHSKISISPYYLKQQIKNGTPLIASMLLSGSATYVDGFLVANKFNEATLAIFRYGTKEIPFITLLANAFSNSMLPVLAVKSNLNEGLEKIKTYSKKLCLLLFPISIGFMFLSHWFFPIVFNPDFIQSAPVFNVFLLLIISRLVFPQTILIAQNKSTVVLISSAIELAINISCSIIFINYWGIEGVALATFIAYLSQKIIMAIYLKTKMNINPNRYIPIKTWVVCTTLLIAIYFFIRFSLF